MSAAPVLTLRNVDIATDEIDAVPVNPQVLFTPPHSRIQRNIQLILRRKKI
jgi:hypothetical protein